ncbi:hypothetical protein SEPCBS119000_002983 [Sporothrix epigloea]|uniref:Uncharacterized protein n=1 Tax=Sporothrix epigloea TaxID=1892477 RepID=A0ABP0DLV3_9PEZI
MTALDNNGFVELHLASIWRYHPAGVERVLAALRHGHPEGQYTFEEEAGWFKASCRPGNVSTVQSLFQNVLSDLERSIHIPPLMSLVIDLPLTKEDFSRQ